MLVIKNYFFSLLSAEISRFSKYYPETVQFSPLEHDDLTLYKKIISPKKAVVKNIGEIPANALVLLNGNLNYQDEIQENLQNLQNILGRHGRVIVVSYNSYLKYFYWLAGSLGLRAKDLPTVFLTKVSLNNLCKLSNFEITKVLPCGFFPFKLLGIGSFINKLLPTLGFLDNFSLAQVIVLRPIKKEINEYSFSIVIPARNEKGNIANALTRLPHFKTKFTEVIFVEGNSTDGTFEEIKRVVDSYHGPLKLSYYKQTTKGKKNAVDIGFEKATGDILTVLDADLTMPPEKLPLFFNAFVENKADFINGNRLFYPMEGKAMRFLNLLGNMFFSKSLSYVLRTDLSDTLCGTKLFSRFHYEIFMKWNREFGEFDPFGDYEMIFPASETGSGIINIPIKYRDRTYGETNISRFYHGFMLLKMTTIGLLRIRMGRT